MKTDWREKYRVRISAAFGIAFLWGAKPEHVVLLICGFIVSFAGLFLRQWAAGCVRKNDELADTGPYAMVRHPLYAGSFLISLGMVLAATVFKFRLFDPHFELTFFYWISLWALGDSIYLPKILREEEQLREKFGARYVEFCRTVPRLLPKAESVIRPDFSTFSKELWKKNQEYSSAIGFAAIWIVLLFRYIYHR